MPASGAAHKPAVLSKRRRETKTKRTTPTSVLSSRRREEEEDDESDTDVDIYLGLHETTSDNGLCIGF